MVIHAQNSRVQVRFGRKTKFASAGRRDQHARRVRSPELPASRSLTKMVLPQEQSCEILCNDLTQFFQRNCPELGQTRVGYFDV